MPKILLVEDDPLISRSLTQFLGLEGFQVSHAASLKDARQAYAGTHFDLILLDLNLPDGNGMQFCREVRSSGGVAPVLILTATTDEETAVRGLETGANDYIRKPFGNRELLARIRSSLALSKTKGKVLVYSSLRILIDDRKAYWNETEIPLSQKEFDLLVLLARRPESPISRDDLVSQMDPEGEILDRTIDSHISRIRTKLKQAGATAISIQSVYGLGYQLGKES